MHTRQISIENWRQLTADGTAFAVQIQLYGNSMWPLIRREKDLVTILPVNRALLKGDIVLFQRADGAYVVHRVISVANNVVQTLGDNTKSPDAPLALDCIIGLITHVQRGKMRIHVDTPFFRFMGRIWFSILPVRNLTRRCVALIKKAGRLLFRRK